MKSPSGSVGLYLFRSWRSRPTSRLLVLALVGLLTSWPKPVPAQVSDSGQSDVIRGTVMNSVTHEPVGHALVHSPDDRFATMSDADGHFEFTLPKTATPETGSASKAEAVVLPARISRPGILMARKPGFLEPRRGTPTSEDEITLTLVPEALVVGRVSLPTAEAAERIQVELYRHQVREGRPHWVPAGSVMARSNGEFRFAELAAGSYKLLTREMMDRDPLTFDPRGQLYGYPPVYYPAATDFTGAGTIQLEPGKVFHADLRVVRQAYYPVKVPVANVPAGIGLAVVVLVQGHRGPGFALGYNYQDQMIEGMLPNGNYTIEAASFGPVMSSGMTNIAVRGGPFEGGRMVLVSDTRIPVNVREEFTYSQETNQGEVAASSSYRGGFTRLTGTNINITLQPAEDFGQERGGVLVPATKDHSPVLENVQPGRYWVRFDTSRGYVASATCGSTDLLHQPLVVGSGGSPPPIEIVLRDDSAEISGTVEEIASRRRKESNAGVGSVGTIMYAGRFGPYSPGAPIYFVPLSEGPGQFREGWVEPDGSFTSPPLAPGSYRVLAFDQQVDELEYHSPEAMHAYDSRGPLVRVVAGQKERLQLHLISSAD